MVGNRHGLEVDIFQAANVDRSHAIALRIGALAEGMYAADRTESMLDYVLIEGIGAHVLLRRHEMQARARDEPHEGTLALTN